MRNIADRIKSAARRYTLTASLMFFFLVHYIIREYKNRKKSICDTLLIYGLYCLIGILIILLYKVLTANQVSCPACESKYTVTNNYFNWFCSGTLLILIGSRLYVNRHDKHWDKAPTFLSILNVYIGSSLTFIALFYGFHDDDMGKYDTTNNKNGWFWFLPSRSIEFPIKQIQLNEKSEYGSFDGRTIDIDTLLKVRDSVHASIDLYLTLIDRTTSGSETQSLQTLYQNDKKKALVDYSQSTNTEITDSQKFYNRPLRDHLGYCINSLIAKTHPNIAYKSCVVLLDGRGHYKSVFNNKLKDKDSILKNNYYDDCDYLDSIAKKAKKRELTDFCKFIESTNKVIEDSFPFREEVYYNVHLSLISDFCHEAHDPGVSSFTQLEQALSDFSSRKNFDIKQVNLYKLPLKTLTVNNVLNTETNLKLFQKQYEMINNIYNCDVKYYEDKKITIFNEAVFAPVSNLKLEPVKFYYSKENNEITTKLCFKSSSSDNLTCQLINDNISDIIANGFNFYYYVEGKGTPSDQSVRSINFPFSIENIYSNDKLSIQFHKKNFSEDNNYFKLEFYSNKYNSKVRIPIEFCPILPNTTNFSLLITYTLFFTSLFLYSLFPAHFFLFEYLNRKGKLNSKTAIIISILLLLILGLCFILYFKLFNPLYNNNNTSIKFSKTNLFNIILPNYFIAFVVVIFPSYFKYRYFLSAFLCEKNADLYKELSSTFWGRRLVRLNKNNCICPCKYE